MTDLYGADGHAHRFDYYVGDGKCLWGAGCNAHRDDYYGPAGKHRHEPDRERMCICKVEGCPIQMDSIAGPRQGWTSKGAALVQLESLDTLRDFTKARAAGDPVLTGLLTWAEDEQGEEDTAWPVFSWIAAGYADDPEYREEWRP